MGAISVVYPLGQVVVGLGLLFGNGAASYISRLLGRGDKENADKVASTALYSSVSVGAVIIIHFYGVPASHTEALRGNRQHPSLCRHIRRHLHCFLHLQCIQCHDE